MIDVRLVKGAYWDAEIKRCQEQGLADYPVFTRKPHTDVAYLACARLLLEGSERLYPQFASHNAHTVAWRASTWRAARRRSFEFQRLHGMGEELYARLPDAEGHADRRAASTRPSVPTRTCSPTSFGGCSRTARVAPSSTVSSTTTCRSTELVADPVGEVESRRAGPHPRIPRPARLFGARASSVGVNLADGREQQRLAAACAEALEAISWLPPLSGERLRTARVAAAARPSDLERVIGEVAEADASLATRAMELAAAAQPEWDRVAAGTRARFLGDAADRLERETARFVAICVAEAGKTVPDSIAEVREAVDFLRYYAARAEESFGRPLALPGPTGESNRLALRGRGVFACISPWNFPLAIFTGQVAAALAAGNSVIAKPAEQTPLVAAEMVRLLHASGIPGDVLHLLTGGGSRIGPTITGDPRIAGVAFTGSTETARLINRTLAASEGPLPVLIAETGGQNAMLVDSSALPEQVVNDAVTSAFNAAGQRCSALRVLFVQEEIAPRVLELLAGVMDTLAIGDPALLSTDVGPSSTRRRSRRSKSTRSASSRARAGIIARSCRPGSRRGIFSRRSPSRSTGSGGSSARCSDRSCTSSGSPDRASTKWWTRSTRAATA